MDPNTQANPLASDNSGGEVAGAAVVEDASASNTKHSEEQSGTSHPLASGERRESTSSVEDGPGPKHPSKIMGNVKKTLGKIMRSSKMAKAGEREKEEAEMQKELEQMERFPS
ncbi:uncharacterized protein VTP21DRAFT_488 [Calcarisporiella thermophila]|uniref:uncharacterized protein n=1 Tax=Calcarisporiella thermophila TaxID=911321 RepID=UPI0037428F46